MVSLLWCVMLVGWVEVLLLFFIGGLISIFFNIISHPLQINAILFYHPNSLWHRQGINRHDRLSLPLLRQRLQRRGMCQRMSVLTQPNRSLHTRYLQWIIPSQW